MVVLSSKNSNVCYLEISNLQKWRMQVVKIYNNYYLYCGTLRLQRILHMLPFLSLQVPPLSCVNNFPPRQAPKLSNMETPDEDQHSQSWDAILSWFFPLTIFPHRGFQRGFFLWTCWPHVLNKLFSVGSFQCSCVSTYIAYTCAIIYLCTC